MLMKNFSIVFQDVVPFNNTIMENIRVGRKDATDEDVIAAAEEQGVTLTEEQAVAWWEKNGRRFQDLMVEHGNEILSNMDFEEVE